jgi:ABC-type multidrug transport system ATPase subunit
VKTKPAPIVERPDGLSGLAVSDLAKRFGRRRVLSGLGFECERGEIVAVTGDNGSGKSTLLAILAGVIEPDRGAATLGGEALIGRRAPARKRIGYVPEAADPPGQMTAADLFTLVAALKGAAPPSPEQIELLELDALLAQSIGSMSLGQRRRVCLAAALVGDPDLLILDEPSNGLDAGGIDALTTLVLGRPGCAVLATHDRELIERLEATELSLSVAED